MKVKSLPIFIDMTKFSKSAFIVSIGLMLLFFGTQSHLVFDFIKYIDEAGYFTYAFILAFIPFLIVFFLEYIRKNKKGKERSLYITKLNDVLISQSQNPLFYEGNITEGAKALTK